MPPAGWAPETESETGMWLWFPTSFHSQLSDRFLLRWHLLHDGGQKRGTVQKWGSCCPTCQAVSVTSSLSQLLCDSTTLTAAITKLKLQPCKFCTFSPTPTTTTVTSTPHSCTFCLPPCLPVSAVTHLSLIYLCHGPTCADMLMRRYRFLSHRIVVISTEETDCWHQNKLRCWVCIIMKIQLWHHWKYESLL